MECLVGGKGKDGFFGVGFTKLGEILGGNYKGSVFEVEIYTRRYYCLDARIPISDALFARRDLEDS